MHAGSAAVHSGSMARGVYPAPGAAAAAATAAAADWRGKGHLPPQQQSTFPGQGARLSRQQLILGSILTHGLTNVKYKVTKYRFKKGCVWELCPPVLLLRWGNHPMHL